MTTAAPPIPRSAVLADLARVLALCGEDSRLADQAVAKLMTRAGCDWPALLDLRLSVREDTLDAMLLAGDADEPPLAWAPGYAGLAYDLRWTAARVIASCAGHLPPRLVAEAAVRANRPVAADEDPVRLRVLARHGWRLRQEATGVVAVEHDDADAAAERGA